MARSSSRSLKFESGEPRLLRIQIFLRHVVFRNLARAHFLAFALSGILNARNYTSLKCVAFFEQLVDTFRIDTFDFG